ncbi:hypothetical protein C8A05DRAFT_32697 [Staphylotrichum tortipilum]|uniref:Uncharacterized protein n=1 Tax=Staphylotrichum tortipilum TaxID=2831512 RepID=A0AAN6RU57_9PEZI|nr:hypothetical protein C8A05DRAFT_32697 [Staphylotrichum longicolle]
MQTLRKLTTLPGLRASTTLRATTTRAAATDARRSTSRPAQPATTTSATPLTLASHRDTSPTTPYALDERTRTLYRTQIYHGQSGPAAASGTRAIHYESMPASIAGVSPHLFGTEFKGNPTESEADVAADRCDYDPLPPGGHMYGVEYKGNPTESEADVAADRSAYDPLPMQMHHAIRMGAGGAAAKPTESEEDVVADREGVMDPIWGAGRHHH